MMCHTCLNSKYKYLFSIFENFPTVSFKAPLTIKHNTAITQITINWIRQILVREASLRNYSLSIFYVQFYFLLSVFIFYYYYVLLFRPKPISRPSPFCSKLDRSVFVVWALKPRHVHVHAFVYPAGR